MVYLFTSGEVMRFFYIEGVKKMETMMGMVLGGVIATFVLFIGVLVAMQWNMHAVTKTHDATLVLWPRWLERFMVTKLITKMEAKKSAREMDANDGVLLVQLYARGIALKCSNASQQKLEEAIETASGLSRDIGDLVRLADAIPCWQKLPPFLTGWHICRLTPGDGCWAGWKNFRNRPYLMHEFQKQSTHWNSFASEVSCRGRLDILKDMYETIPCEYLQRVERNTNNPIVRLEALKLLQDWDAIAKSVADIGDSDIRSKYLDTLYQQGQLVLRPSSPAPSEQTEKAHVVPLMSRE